MLDIGELYILRRGRLRVRDFLNTEYCCVILAGKGDSRRQSATSFSENVVVAEKSYLM